jgi:WD40 repeat protein
VSLVWAGIGAGAPAPKADSDRSPEAPLARLGPDRFRAAGHVQALTFSPDGTRLAALAEHGLSVWDAATGREVRFVPWRYARPRGVAWPGKGQPLAVLNPANDGTYLWAFADDKTPLPRTALGEDPEEGVPDSQRARFSHVTISADGTRAAAGDAEAKGPIRVWPAAPGKRLGELEALRTIDVGDAGWADFGLSPDGKTLLVFGSERKDGRVRLTLFDADTGKERKRLTVPAPAAGEGARLAFAVSADGQSVVLGRADTTTVVVDFDGGEGPFVLGRAASTEDRDRVVAISPDGNWVAADEFGRVVVWNAVLGRQVPALKQVRGLVSALAFSPDSKTLACASRSGLVQQWDTRRWAPIAPPDGHTDSVAGVAVSPDGKTAVTAGADRTVRVWEVAGGAEVRAVNLEDSPDSVHFAPDGRSVVISASEFGRGRKFGTKFARLDLTGGSESVAGELGKGFGEDWPASRVVGFGPDGKTFLTRRRRTITLWGWPAGTKRRAVDIAADGVPADELNCRSAALSPDGRLLAVGLEREQRRDFGRVVEPAGTCVVDAATGDRRWSLTGPAIWFSNVAFTPDGRRLVVGGRGDFKGDELNEERTSLALVDAATGALVRRFQLPDGVGEGREVTAVTVSLDGRTATVGERDHSLTVYELATGKIRQRLVGHRSEVKELLAATGGRLLSVAWHDQFALVWATSPAAAAGRAPLAEAGLDAEWEKLGRTDAVAAFRAMSRMAGDPAATVGYLRRKLSPAKPPGAKALDEVFAGLEAAQADDREKASEALDDLGRAAVEAARARLKETKAEDARARLARFLERQEHEELITEELRAVRAVELLESIGGGEGRTLMADLAKGAPAAWLTTEAAGALRRLQPKRD